MRAMVLQRICSVSDEDQPLALVDMPVPVAAGNEVLLSVTACGVCHTELDEIEGRTPPPTLPMVLGHQVVGSVVELGTDVQQLKIGDRVGVGWIHSSSGGDRENISPEFVATGRDVHGGYAEYMSVPERYAYPIPAEFTDTQAAPLLCAGAIGYRALKLTGIKDGDKLGLAGFGGSAHLVLPLARHLFPNSSIFVFARNEETQEFARQMGADWADDHSILAPYPLDAIIDTTPAWSPIVHALKNLKPGGRLVINAIRKEDDDKAVLLDLSYSDHLWMEREIKSVANITHADISEFLTIAASIPLVPEVQTYPLAEANKALVDLKRRTVRGAKVLVL